MGSEGFQIGWTISKILFEKLVFSYIVPHLFLTVNKWIKGVILCDKTFPVDDKQNKEASVGDHTKKLECCSMDASFVVG